MRNLLLALALLAAAPLVARAQVEPDERDVYRTVLSSLVRPETRLLVLADSTAAWSLSERAVAWLRRQAPEITPGLLDHFRRRYAVRAPLPDSLSLPVPVVVLTEPERRSLAPGGDPDEYWAEFYERFPDSPGHVRLSRVGFSPDGAQALVYVYHACGGRCGAGAFLLLQREGGEWSIIRRIVREQM